LTSGGFNNSAAGSDIRVAADSCIRAQFSISNPQQFLPLAQLASEAHALGNLQLPVAIGNPAAKINTGRCPPMETVLSILDAILVAIQVAFLAILVLAWPILFAIYAIPFGIFAMVIASGSGKWESEDQAQYERFNPRV
jgi:hypothetical protein